MARGILRQEDIDFAISLGKITLGLHGRRIAKGVLYGDYPSETLTDFQKLWIWLRALEGQKEINLTGDVETCITVTTNVFEIGDSFGGGVVFYKTGLNALIATNNVLPLLSTWTPTSDTLPFIDVTTNTAIGTGQANTTAILAAVGSNPTAAKACDDLVEGGESDWYLPSQDEIQAMSDVRSIIGGVATGFSWSSSQSPGNTNSAQILNIATGVSSNGVAKDETHYVRPIRSALLPTPGTVLNCVTAQSDSDIHLEYQNNFTDETAREVISKISTMATRHLPKLIYRKFLENRLQYL